MHDTTAISGGKEVFSYRYSVRTKFVVLAYTRKYMKQLGI